MSDGKSIEEVGIYNPLVEPSVIELNEEAVKKWLANGAKPTGTVTTLLKKTNIVE